MVITCVVATLPLGACASLYGGEDSDEEAQLLPPAVDGGADTSNNVTQDSAVEVPSPQTCVDQGVNLQTDAQNCGRCGRICNAKIANACVAGDCARIVFISSTYQNGNLGGLAGADAKCNALASAAGLHGKFAAWLSTMTVSPSMRFVKSTRPYYLVNNTIVANSFSALTTMNLQAAITLTENGQTPEVKADAGQNPTHVWSNTRPNGTPVEGTVTTNTCQEFTDDTIASLSSFGHSRGDVMGPDWTMYVSSALARDRCNEQNHLYCFEQ